MKKTLLVLLVLVSFIFIACNSNETKYLSTVSLSKSDIEKGGTYRISDTSEINLSELNPLYLYSVKVDSSSPRSIKTRARERMYDTEVGSTLIIPNSDGTFSFYGKDLGVSGVSNMKIDNILCADDDFKIEESDPYLTVYRDGIKGKLYEEFYLVNLNDLDGIDLSDVAIANIGLGYGGCDEDYGIITDIKDLFYGFSSEKAQSVLDLRGKEYIWLYNSLLITESENPRSKELKIVNPIDLELDKPISIDDTSNIYRVKKDNLDRDSEYVIEITCSDIEANNYAMINDNSNPRYENGIRKKYLFPMSKYGETLTFYVGEVDDDFIFDFYMSEDEYPGKNLGQIKLREIRKDSDFFRETEIKDGYYEKEISISEDTPKFIPIKIKSLDDKSISNLKVTMKCNDCKKHSEGTILVTMSGHVGGLGYSRMAVELNDCDDIIIRSHDTAEYAYMEINHVSGHTIEISITPNN